MSKVINSIIDSQETQQNARDTLVLKFVDFLHPTGERVKYVQKKSNKKQMERVTLRIREVEYVYQTDSAEKPKITHGFEIVEEVLIEKEVLEKTGYPQQVVVGKVTRHIKKKKNE